MCIRDRQYTGIAAVACVDFFSLHPNILTISGIDYIVIIGDRYLERVYNCEKIIILKRKMFNNDSRVSLNT